jgi:beta-mannosidase
VQWVGEKVWIYRLEFTPPPPPSGNHVISELVFEGLDTFATASLNGAEILETENMFVLYRVNVSEHIKPGELNVLEIVFDSALLRGRQLVKDHSHEHNFLVRQTEAGRVPVRKAQYNWGWDWGPVLMTAGPWKPVYLEQYTARIDDVWAQNTVSKDLKRCEGTIFAKVEGRLPDNSKVVFSLEKDGKTVFEKEIQPVNGTAQVPFQLENPELWYPLNYGRQTRYKLTARITAGSSDLDSKSILTGFRRTQLVQEPDAYGKSFYFRINNIDIFGGGSCWIPGDSYLSQISAQRYYDWIKLMAEGNQVMIRVWGGGIYEDDALLDACDELGVLVWHDFQFACASYPAYSSYLQNFEVEARQQIRRMRWRPSVVIWAGNNEDYQVQERYKLDYDFENKDPESWLKSTFPARYIYEHLLPTLMNEEDPHNIYYPSSPWGDGKPTADPTVGDIHQWNRKSAPSPFPSRAKHPLTFSLVVWHGAQNKYQEVSQLSGRFISEFGMEAYPHLSTTARMSSTPSQLYPGSMVLDFHNKGIGHERRMMTYVVENFRPRTDLASYTHLTQAVQAETMRFAYKTWRREWQHRKCGGVLVWQLNDCWPTMSWAVVDYYLVPKPAYYAIKRALRPVDVGVVRTYEDWTQTGYYIDENSKLCTGQVDQTLPARRGQFDVWIANGRVKEIEAVVAVRFVSVRSGEDVHPAMQKSVTAAANTTTDVFAQCKLPTSIPEPENLNRPFNVAEYDPYVIHATVSLDGGNTVVSDTAWPDPIKFLDMPDRGVKFDISAAGDCITVSAKRPVKSFVFEEVEGMKLSDNGFDIVPGETHVVQVSGPLKASELRWTHIEAEGASLPVS